MQPVRLSENEYLQRETQEISGQAKWDNEYHPDSGPKMLAFKYAISSCWRRVRLNNSYSLDLELPKIKIDDSLWTTILLSDNS